jgi:hypothetical protein
MRSRRQELVKAYTHLVNSSFGDVSQDILEQTLDPHSLDPASKALLVKMTLKLLPDLEANLRVQFSKKTGDTLFHLLDTLDTLDQTRPALRDNKRL